LIHIEQIRKSYNGTRGLDSFSLRIGAGELCGLVGPNGAGKTTLIKILATLLPPDGGQATVAGIDVTQNRAAIKALVGYMPDQPGLYQDMRVKEFLEFFADAFRISGARRSDAVDHGLQRSGLAERSAAFVEELSFGMKQRLLLAKTLLHEPKVLLLDEPATGLDPLARIDLRQRLRELSNQGLTILVSSHILADLEEICDRVALISEGRNAVDASGQSVLEMQPAKPQAAMYEIEVLGEIQPAVAVVGSIAGVRVLQSEGQALLVEIAGGPSNAAALLRAVVGSGLDVVRFERPSLTLEQRYRQIFGGGRQ